MVVDARTLAALLLQQKYTWWSLLAASPREGPLDNIASRRVATFIADGFDALAHFAMQAALTLTPCYMLMMHSI